MSAARLSRRGLFEALLGRRRSAAAARASSFSLDEFYARRCEQAGIPTFELRSGLPDAGQHSTRVGVPELCSAARERQDEEPK